MNGAPRTWLVVSVTRAESARLASGGPLRDYLELQRVTGGEIVYVDGNRRARGILARLLGAHVRQAWQTAGMVQTGDRVFADGEHNGLPLAVFLRIRRRRAASLVMLGHLLSPRWKRAGLRLASRAGCPATLLVHSVVQLESVRGVIGRRWTAELTPYHVDTDFWQAERTTIATPPLVVAAGSENRDYETLIAAAAQEPGVRVVIAAGSHWARNAATTNADLPENVEFIAETLTFGQLRALYSQATAVVVPLHDVDNQSGVTTILEGMSMGLPVIASATRGQRECVRGPEVRASGGIEWGPTADRGPQLFGAAAGLSGVTGVYVEPGNAGALSAALALARAGHLPTATRAGIREVATRSFDTAGMVDTIHRALLRAGSAAPRLAEDNAHHAEGYR